jgi:excisionase family DNA binding protein
MVQLSFPMPDDGRSGGRSAYVTVAEAAAELHCHERTIRRAIDRGALRAGRVRGANAARGSWRIRREDLDAWLYAEPPE